MSGPQQIALEITPQVLLKAYACGIFPMAESADDPGIFWVEPEVRGIIPLDAFRLPRRLARTMRTHPFDIRVDTAFETVVAACAQATQDRPNTWINQRIANLYGALHRLGHCHSVECWEDGELAGGLYGVRLGGAFFGESMFTRKTDASKIALAHLVERLKTGGFTLLDTQFTTDHLKRFGAIDIGREDYLELLEEAVTAKADFYAIDGKQHHAV